MSFKFKQFAPRVPSTLVLHVYEEVFYRAVIEVEENLSPHKVIVEVLTTQRDSKEPSGALHPLKLHLRGPLQEKNMYVYGASAILISMCTFEFSYRAKIFRSQEWLTPPTQPEIHGIARVLAADPMKLAPLLKNQPNFSHIVGPLYIGDAVTLEQVPNLEFTHVLCVDSELQPPWWVDKLRPVESPSIFNLMRKKTYAGISYVHALRPVRESPKDESTTESTRVSSYNEESVSKVEEDTMKSPTSFSLTAPDKPDEPPALEAIAPEGITPEGIAPEGIAPEGIAPEGISPEGISPEGIAPEGIAPEGIAPEGIAPEGIAPEGIAPEGIAPERIAPNVDENPTDNANENNAEESKPDVLTLEIPNSGSPDTEKNEIAVPELDGPDAAATEFASPEILAIDILSPDIGNPDIIPDIGEVEMTINPESELETEDATISEAAKSLPKSEADKADVLSIKPEGEKLEFDRMSTKTKSEESLAEEVEPPKEESKWNPVLFHWIPYPSTPEKHLRENLLRETVEWLNRCWYEDNCILIASTNGFLKAGMATLAFVYANNLNKTFKQCYDMINCKRPIFFYHNSEHVLQSLFRNVSNQEL